MRSHGTPAAVSTGNVAGVIRRTASASWRPPWPRSPGTHSHCPRPRYREAGREMGQAFGAVLIGHHDLILRGRSIVGEMDPPVIAGAARVPESVASIERTRREPGATEPAGGVAPR